LQKRYQERTSTPSRWVGVGAVQRLEEKDRKNRSRFEISADILEAAAGGARKTHIMYRANLSFNMLCRYLDLLKMNGLLTVDASEDEIYKTTEEGLTFLAAFDDYRRSECLYMDRARSLEASLTRGV